METSTTYILYSVTIDKFYVGHTKDVLSERIRRHNTNHKGFTGQANDWEVVFHHQNESVQEGLKLERRIKKRGAKRYIQGLAERN